MRALIAHNCTGVCRRSLDIRPGVCLAMKNWRVRAAAGVCISRIPRQETRRTAVGPQGNRGRLGVGRRGLDEPVKHVFARPGQVEVPRVHVWEIEALGRAAHTLQTRTLPTSENPTSLAS